MGARDVRGAPGNRWPTGGDEQQRCIEREQRREHVGCAVVDVGEVVEQKQRRAARSLAVHEARESRDRLLVQRGGIARQAPKQLAVGERHARDVAEQVRCLRCAGARPEHVCNRALHRLAHGSRRRRGCDAEALEQQPREWRIRTIVARAQRRVMHRHVGLQIGRELARALQERGAPCAGLAVDDHELSAREPKGLLDSDAHERDRGVLTEQRARVARRDGPGGRGRAICALRAEVRVQPRLRIRIRLRFGVHAAIVLPAGVDSCSAANRVVPVPEWLPVVGSFSIRNRGPSRLPQRAQLTHVRGFSNPHSRHVAARRI